MSGMGRHHQSRPARRALQASANKLGSTCGNSPRVRMPHVGNPLAKTELQRFQFAFGQHAGQFVFAHSRRAAADVRIRKGGPQARCCSVTTRNRSKNFLGSGRRRNSEKIDELDQEARAPLAPTPRRFHQAGKSPAETISDPCAAGDRSARRGCRSPRPRWRRAFLPGGKHSLPGDHVICYVTILG